MTRKWPEESKYAQRYLYSFNKFYLAGSDCVSRTGLFIQVSRMNSKLFLLFIA